MDLHPQFLGNRMDRKILLGLLSAVLVVTAIAVLIPGGKPPDSNPKLPWLIETTPSGTTRVFGLTLGESTLQDARAVLEEGGDIQMFVSPQDEYSIEAYFQKLYLSGIRADFIMALEVDQATAKEMLSRGLRIKIQTTGNKKVDLAEEDVALLRDARIKHISYIPAANLDEELIRGRFGEPAYTLPEPEAGAIHWMYPDKGLDIALDPEGKELFQYVSPARFGELEQRLKAMQQK
jgi:hypothetical protein